MGYLKLLIIISVICRACSTTIDRICNEDELLCGDGSKCIKPIQLCDYTPDCEDYSDETNFKLCKKLSIHKIKCPDLTVLKVKCSDDFKNDNVGSYLRNQCVDILSACSHGNKCFGLEDSTFCSAIADRLLKPSVVIKKRQFDKIPEYSDNFYKMVDFISEAFNETVMRYFTSCPRFFTPFKGKCYSFFLPAQVTWSEAKLFCESISSGLAVLDDVHKFKAVLDIIKEKGLKSNFWIGGYTVDDFQILENSTKKWTWLNKKPVEMGAPFWGYSLVDSSLNYICNKVEKSIRPRNKYTEEMCLALLENNYYYFSDETCNEKFSPICVLK